VRHNPDRQRFELDTPAGLAVAHYRLSANVITIPHTEVPLSVRGRLYGYRLVHGALDEALRLHLNVVPECWFVREVIDRNSEFRDLL
jgi:hypothetical protein